MATIKGLVLLDAVRSVRQRVGEETLQRVVQSMPDPWRGLLRSQLLPTSWYPLEAFVQFLDADLAVTGKGDTAGLGERAAAVIVQELNGVYSVLSRQKTPAFFVQRVAGINETYFNGISVNVTMVGPNCAKISYVGFSPHHGVIEILLTTFYSVALKRSGAQQVTVTLITPMRAGNGRCELEVSWVQD